jgi:hypothetical protein
MEGRVFTSEALERALANDELAYPGLELVGMVKASDQTGQISFTLSGCDQWVDLPTVMIHQAEQLGSSRCKDHSHPVFRLRLKEPDTPEAEILYALLAQQSSSPRWQGVEWCAFKCVGHYGLPRWLCELGCVIFGPWVGPFGIPRNR